MNDEINSGGLPETEAPASKPYTKICATPGCKTEFDPEGLAYKFCKKHRIEQSDQKKYNRAAADRSRGKKKEQSFVWNSKLIPSKSEAMELLSARITNRHVAELCYGLALEAAEQNDVIPNKYNFQNGLTQALASKQAGESRPLEMDHSAIITSEVIHAGDAYGIFDFSVSWREPDVTFESFIQTRARLKSDWLELGYFMGRGGPFGFCERPHRDWQQFLPKFVPALRPGYTQSEERDWLAAQVPDKQDFLLMASRNSLKSSVGLLFLTTAVLCAPCLRLLLISETTKLSRGFVKAFRSIWEVGHERNRFQYWFPEYCVPQGSGSVLEFECPLKHLPLPQATASAASLEMAMAGQRFSIAWVDDPVSNINTNTEELRIKGLETYDVLMKLREAGGGSAVVTIGTAWVGGSASVVGDLYFELQKRNDRDPDKPLAVLVQPAWAVKETARNRDILQLTEDDIESLAYPTRLSFKFLMKEARANIDLFYSQNLCEYRASEEDKWVVTFTLDELQARVKPMSFFEGSPIVMRVGSCDSAFSEAITADKSAVVSALVFAHKGKNVAYILNVHAGRWKYSDLSIQIVQEFAKYNVQRAVIERLANWLELQAGIQRQAGIRGVVLPHIIFKQSFGTGMSVSRKVFRAKNTELALENDQLYFAPGVFNDSLFSEMTNFTGKRSSSRKDDMVDGIGLIIEKFIIHDRGTEVKPVLTAEQEEAEQQAYRQEMSRLHYQTMFGTQPGQIPVSQPTEPEPVSATDHYWGRLRR